MLILAKELEKQGAHILAIKDMAGLFKPEAAYGLVAELKETCQHPNPSCIHMIRAETAFIRM